MHADDVIRKKRDGGELSSEEMAFLIDGLALGSVTEAQGGAFLMAAYLKGLTYAETLALTDAMLASSRRLDVSGLAGRIMAKHSTGGVGDKTSLILGPIMAAMGVKMPSILARGLAHTGGTLDKVESIPGMKTCLTHEEFRRAIETVGVSMVAQDADLAPACRLLSGLRDSTATAESMPLIAADVMSRALAEGVEGLVLDVKCGSGAFARDRGQARELARTMVRIGTAHGVRTVAVVSNMNRPLGMTVGNALEVKECITAMRGAGRGGAKDGELSDLLDLTLTLSAWMLYVADSISEEIERIVPMTKQAIMHYRREVLDFIEHGDVFGKFLEFVDAQGGDPEAVLQMGKLPSARVVKPVLARTGGYMQRLDALSVGRAAMALGAGRLGAGREEIAGDAIDPAAGIVLSKKPGDEVRAGEPLAMFHMGDEARHLRAEEIFLSGVLIGDRDPGKEPLVYEVVMEEDVK